MIDKQNRKKRPISPHITIYKWQITSVLSILHRITGVIGFFGLLSLLWMVMWVMYHQGKAEDCFVYQLLISNFGSLILILWTYSLFFHLCTGIRHLFWDAHIGFDLKVVTITGWMATIASLVMTIIFWCIIKI